MTGHILVVRGGALGDFVLGLPALGMLRDAFPDARLELVASGPYLPLARPLADTSAPLDRAEFAPLFGDGSHLPESLVERYSDLDLAVLWLADLEGAVRRNFARLGAKRVLQAPALPQVPGVHAADHLVGTLVGVVPCRDATADRGVASGFIPDALSAGEADSSGTSPDATPLRDGKPGRRDTGPRPLPLMHGNAAAGDKPLPYVSHWDSVWAVPRVSPGADARLVADGLWRRLGLPDAGRVVAIHPGSGGRWKCWPAERFARVAEALAEAGVRPVVLQGPADEEVVGQLLSATVNSLPVAAGLEVEALAAFLSRCSAYLGNDSGVTHLAAAAGTPVVAVFGPTDPAVWGPRGTRVVVLRQSESLEAVSVEQVTSAIIRML